MAVSWDGEANPNPQDLAGILLKPGERIFYIVRGAFLVESRHAPGHYTGGSQGFTFHVMKGVNYRVGANRGTYTPGPESPTIIDQGIAAITSNRVMFAGAKQTREWSFDKLIGMTVETPGPWLALPVSNRQKTSGIGYGETLSEEVEFRLHLAWAIHSNSRPAFVAAVTAQRDAFAATRPAAVTQA